MRWSGIRLLEVFKLLLAVSFGLSLRTVFDISFGKLECPQCPSCAPKKDQDSPLLPADVHQQLREPYKPKTMYDVIRYDYFNTRHIFNNIDDDPRIGLAGFQKANIRDAIHQALLLFNSGKPQEWKYKSLMNGYKRQDPLRGEEYIFDLEIHQASKPEVTKMERIEIVKPFTSAHLVDNHSVQTSKVVHFILPVTGSSARFTHFLLEYEKVVLLSKAAARMIVILFVGTTLPEQKSAEKLKTMITDINRRYRLSKIKLIQTKKMFSRALGLDLGAKQLPGNSLLFFCDIDVTITPSFLSRCRNNAILEKQVYYPIVFGQYQPDIVVDHSPEDQVKDLMTINKYTGMCNKFSSNILCFHSLFKCLL